MPSRSAWPSIRRGSVMENCCRSSFPWRSIRRRWIGKARTGGTQYRSALFVSGADQERVARAYIAQLEAAHAFSRPIATRIEPAGPFYPAEAYHQDYLEHHPDAPYIAINDMPKVRAVQTLFPANWRTEPALVVKTAAGNYTLPPEQ